VYMRRPTSSRSKIDVLEYECRHCWRELHETHVADVVDMFCQL